MALRAYADNIKRSYIDACNAVLARGGNVTSGMPISDLSSAILNIPHDQTLAYYKQENTKHIITVPRNSEPYARIGKIGGMTYKSENYFDKSKVTNSDVPLTVTDTGFSFTNTVADKQPTPIGYLKNLAPNLKVGDVVTFYAKVVNASIDRGYGFLYITEAKVDWLGGNFITITEAHLSGMVYAYGALNKVCEYKNLIITKEENAPYSPYFEGLRDTKVTELRSEGANLIPPPTRNWTSNGITFSVQEDGSIVANGTATSDATFELTKNGLAGNIKLTIGETYTFSCCPKGGSATTYRAVMQHIGYSQNFDDFGSGVTKVTSYEDYYVFIRIMAGYTANNLVFKPMLNRGSTAQPYSKYGTIVDTLPISAELRAFLEDKGYGGGASGYSNDMVFDSKKFVRRTYRKVFDGTENLLDGGLNTEGQTRYSFRLDKQAKESDAEVLCVSSHYSSVSINNTYRGSGNLLGVNGNYIRWIDAEIPTFSLAEMQAKLKAWYDAGDPLIVDYVLAEPIEYDISAYLIDDFIKVEGDGTISAISEYNYDMPSEVNYIINTVGG